MLQFLVVMAMPNVFLLSPSCTVFLLLGPLLCESGVGGLSCIAATTDLRRLVEYDGFSAARLLRSDVGFCSW